MSTSGGGTINALGYVLVLVAALVAARSALGDLEPWLRRPRPAAVGLWLVVAIPSLVELADHDLYDALSRQPDRIRDGQAWRLLTGAVVQDGGLFGTVVNLVILALVGTVAVALWGPGRATVLFVTGVLGFSLSATYLSPEPGGGNSGATFFLAASVVALVAVRRPTRTAYAAAVVVVATSVTLLALLDAHGEAVLAGLLVGAALALIRPPDPIPAA